MDGLDIKTERIEEGIVLIALEGALDSFVAEGLSKAIQDLFNIKIYKFIIDLSRLNYLGSPGVGVFISILDTLEQHNGTIVFIHPKPNVKEVFKLFKLSAFYSVCKDKETAIKELKALTEKKKE